jgi:hypothetical protein
VPTDIRSVPCGSLHPVTKLALYDELEKIAREVSPEGRAFREKAKRFLKGTAAITAGTAAGTGTFMLADRAASALAPKYWNKLSPQTRYAILGAGAALAGGAGTMLTKHLLDEKTKYVEGR